MDGYFSRVTALRSLLRGSFHGVRSYVMKRFIIALTKTIPVRAQVHAGP
jgi:hypothetical protein